MPELPSLEAVTEDMAAAIPTVDAETTGQYGDGLGSEAEERQLTLLLDHLAGTNARYGNIDREVASPAGNGTCDLVLPNGTPVEAKLITTGGRTETPSRPCTATCSARSTGTRS